MGATVLAVDDEELTLRIIKDTLEDAGYDVVTADSGQAALDVLMASPDSFDAMVLDRMMPQMTGMEVLAAVRSNERTGSIPVILQTAASSHQEMREGIEAGAFYYITKPYDENTLVAVVRSAVQSYGQSRAFIRYIANDQTLLAGAGLLEQARFRFTTMEEAKSVVWMIGQNVEECAPFSACLQELIANAIEHGNLGLGGAAKDDLIRHDQWEGEIARRQALPANMGKTVLVTFETIDDDVVVSIEDQGVGFDWQPYFSQDLSLDNRVQGKGIVVARSMSGHTLCYENGGRRAIVRFARG